MEVIVSTPRSRTRVVDYVALTKPRIMIFLAMTAYCSMVVAGRHWPSWPLGADTLLGLCLSIGGAHAINMWYDRDIDQVMERTRQRPIPQGRISPSESLSFGIFLESVAFIWLSLTVNPLTAQLALGGFLFYTLIYTIILKRRTPQNIVIGGAAGAFPPLVGWAAVTDHLSLSAWLLFGIIFLWTPPHFWALALYKEKDYGRAHIPMMPNVYGRHRTTLEMTIYAIFLGATSIVLGLVNHSLSPLYIPLAVIFSGLFIAANGALMAGKLTPQKVFMDSLWYVAGLFGSLVIGCLWHP